MANLDYPREFWQRANELVNGPPQCEQCKAFRNMKVRPRTVVRVVVVKGKGSLVSRLHMMCTKCYPDPVPLKVPKKTVLDKIAELPFNDAGPGVTGRG